MKKHKKKKRYQKQTITKQESDKKIVMDDEELLKQHTKSIIAAFGPLLLGLATVGIGIGISIYAHDFLGFPILMGLALSCLSVMLIVREIKARNKIKEKLDIKKKRTNSIH